GAPRHRSRPRGVERRVVARVISFPVVSGIQEMTILWITAGLGCDGDTIALTAATQPTLEELLQGGIPGLPAVRFHNPFLDPRNGDEFLQPFRDAASGRLAPFILVVEGSIPDERTSGDGFWAALGHDRKTGQPIRTVAWIDELAPRAW